MTNPNEFVDFFFKITKFVYSSKVAWMRWKFVILTNVMENYLRLVCIPFVIYCSYHCPKKCKYILAMAEYEKMQKKEQNVGFPLNLHTVSRFFFFVSSSFSESFVYCSKVSFMACWTEMFLDYERIAFAVFIIW